MSTRMPEKNSRARRPQAAQKQQSNHAERNESARVWKTLGGRVQEVLAKPQLNYMVILTVTMLLTGLGLVMVLSSSMVNSRASGGSVYTEFFRQAAIVVVGLIAMWFALRISPQRMRKLSPYLMGLAFILLIAVLIPGVGVGGDEVGSNSWIRFAGVGIQPSEAAKLALAVFGSSVAAHGIAKYNTVNQALGPLFAAGGVFMLLVMLQKDLGMMLLVGIVMLALVFFAGTNQRAFLGALGIIFLVGVGAIALQAYRSARITTWIDALFLNFSDSSTQGSAYQSHQGILSLSDGGFTGLGLGQSRAKWFYLPEATNDFIFAVVGEELGFLGAILVVVLFGLLGWFGIRTALKHTDPFMRMLSATLTLGVVVQAMINIGYVVGLLPVTGIQLPLISAGGTSAVITLIAMGLLANCARHEPETVSSMQHEGRPLIDRILMLPEPLPVIAGAERRQDRRNTTQQFGEPVTRQRGGAGRVGQDARRERDRLEESRRRVGAEFHERDYDGRRHGSLPPVRETRSERAAREGMPRTTQARRSNRPDSRRR